MMKDSKLFRVAENKPESGQVRGTEERLLRSTKVPLDCSPYHSKFVPQQIYLVANTSVCQEFLRKEMSRRALEKLVSLGQSSLSFSSEGKDS